MNALWKLSTGKRTALAYAALVTATAVTEFITGAGPGVRAVTIGILAAIPGVWLTLRLIGPAKGEHAVPRGWNDGLRPLPVAGRVIPRAAVEGHPPWEDQPPPDARFIAAAAAWATVSVTVLPPPPEPKALPAARPTADDIVAELAAKVYGHGGDTAATEKSNWRKADGLALDAMLGGES